MTAYRDAGPPSPTTPHAVVVWEGELHVDRVYDRTPHVRIVRIVDGKTEMHILETRTGQDALGVDLWIRTNYVGKLVDPMIHAPSTATSAARQVLADLGALLVLLALAGTVLYCASGCTAAAFATEDGTPDDTNAAEATADSPGGPTRLRHPPTPTLAADAGGTDVPDAAPSVDATPPPDTRPPPDTTPAPDTAPPDAGCARRCLIAGSTGANLPLGSPACTFDGQCCSGTCFVNHPGTGEPGVCTAPSGDPTTPHWCGAAGEWCGDAVAAGIARCVP